MRYYTLSLDGKETPCISYDGGKNIYTFPELGITASDIQELIINFPDYSDQIKKGADRSLKAEAVIMNDAAILAPIVHPLRDVICLGANYSEHADESEAFSKEAFGGNRDYTVYFSKRVNRAVGSSEAIPAHADIVDSLDYESELCVVLSKEIKNINESEAMDAVFGYTIINDVSARNIQTRHKQWFLGKSLDGFFPMGPCIVTPDEIDDIYNLKISSSVNGEIRQNSNTGKMTENIEEALSELSKGMTIQAGSLIAMGTPSGVGMGMNPPCFLKPGDKVRCEIEKIGFIENIIID